jgi:hypothetical protein
MNGSTSTAGIGAIGAYPDDPYFDPNRSSWLPYWIDTFEESRRKYDAENLIQATANAAGQATGAVVGGAANAAGSAAGNVAKSTFKSLDLQGTAMILLLGGAGIFLAMRALDR